LTSHGFGRSLVRVGGGECGVVGNTRQVVPTVAVGHRRGILAGETCVRLAAPRLSPKEKVQIVSMV
jgi:hypothetical protein